MRLLLGLVVALFSLSAVAEVYKCTGTDGRITYSDLPCPAAQKSAPMELHNVHVEPRDALAARTRALADKIEVRGVLIQEDYQAKIRSLDRQIENNRRETKQAVCGILQEQSEDKSPTSAAGMAARKSAADRHFSECFSKGY